MGKQRATMGGGGGRDSSASLLKEIRALNSVASKILQRMDRARESADKQARMQQADRKADAASGGAGGSGGGSGDGGGDRPTLRQRMGNMARGAAGGLMTGIGTGIGGAIGAAFEPQVTAREREYGATRALATEASSQLAMGLVRGAGGSEAMQIGAGNAASAAVGGMIDAAFHPVLQKTQQARGGFADLEQMASAGIDISDSMIAERAKSTYQQADRAYEFRNRREAALNEVNRGDFDVAEQSANDGIRAEMEKFKQELQGLTQEMGRARGTLSSDNADSYRSVTGG